MDLAPPPPSGSRSIPSNHRIGAGIRPRLTKSALIRGRGEDRGAHRSYLLVTDGSLAPHERPRPWPPHASATAKNPPPGSSSSTAPWFEVRRTTESRSAVRPRAVQSAGGFHELAQPSSIHCRIP